MGQKFLIVGTQRSGSQALYKGFNFHPDVFCGGEWTLRARWHRKLVVAEQAFERNFDEILVHRPQDRARIALSLRPDTRWLGYKILFRSSDKWLGHPRFSPALFLDRLTPHLDWIRSKPDLHIVHLVRMNMVDWLKSKYLVRRTGWSVHRKYPDKLKITIPIWSALRAAKAKVWVDTQLSTLSSSNPYHRVYYEEFLADNQTTLEKCLAFLDCDPADIPEDAHFIQRQSKGHASDYISNHSELVASLERHGLLYSKPSA